MTRRADDDKPTLPPGADATRRRTAELRARESWLPLNRQVFEVPPDGLLLGGRVFAGLPVLILYLIFQRHIVNAVSGRVA